MTTVLFLFLTQILGAPAGPPLKGAALEAKTTEVAALIRCPVCQGLSVNDSPAEMAVNMKAETRDLLARGYSKEQVLRYFEASYGEFVLLEPPRRGMNWLLWITPVLLVIGGAFVLIRSLRMGGAGERLTDS
jgi:cytochrome c-type biogenesis protein CcmH